MLLKLLFALLVAVNAKMVPQIYSYCMLEIKDAQYDPCVEKCVFNKFGPYRNFLNEGMHYAVCTVKCNNPTEADDKKL